MIFYEAPHHLKKTLAELYAVLGDRKIAVCRELTKRYEERVLMTLSECLDLYQTKEPRGEYVLIVEGKAFEELRKEEQKTWESLSIAEHVKLYEDGGADRKKAMKLVADDRGMRKRDVYQALLQLDP